MRPGKKDESAMREREIGKGTAQERGRSAGEAGVGWGKGEKTKSSNNIRQQQI